MRYDVVVIGGGLVGAGFVAALAGTSLKIALVDARLPSNNDQRLFALNYGSCQFLKNLELWQELKEHACAIHQVHVSHKGRFGAVRLKSQDVGLAELGYVMPAKYIEFALNAKLEKQKNLTVYRPAMLQSLVQENGEAQLRISRERDELILTSPIVMGADGAESTARKQAGIEAETIDYSQTAIVTRSKIKRSHQHIAYERFIKDGAIAMLPLAENECATIWSVENNKAKELLALDDHAFLDKLQRHFGYRLGRLESVGPRFSYPLKLVKAKKNNNNQVYLLGNAAHTVHPIAAQGFNLAMYEVAALVEVIKERLNKQKTINIADLLGASDRINKQQKISINVSHKLADLFLTQSKIKQSVLQLGMLTLDLAVPAKRKFISAILGQTGSTPTLLMDELG